MIWGLFLLLFSAAGNCTENLNQLVYDTKVLTALTPNRQSLTDQQIIEFINQGQREALSLSRCLQNSTTFQLTPGVTYYAMPSDFLAVSRVTIGTKWMQEMSPAALDGRSRSWETASGYPTYYFINWSTPTSIGFAPWPGVGADTDTIKVDYFQFAAPLTLPGDVPYNGNPKLSDYHHALSYFAAFLISLAGDRAAVAQAYYAIFQGAVAQMGKRCFDRPNYMPGATGQN